MTYEGPGHLGMEWRRKQGEEAQAQSDPLGFGVHVTCPLCSILAEMAQDLYHCMIVDNYHYRDSGTH